tara:strand:- start:86 stop:472 length:387 start_codon:yes stop_codon:yes gene_type:complete
MRKTHWLYLGLLVLLALGRLAQKLATDTGGFASRYLPLIIVIILVTGFIGFMSHKPLFKRWVWLVFFWLLITASAGMFFFSIYLFIAIGTGGYIGALVIITGLALISPVLAVLYKYAFQSPKLWCKGN